MGLLRNMSPKRELILFFVFAYVWSWLVFQWRDTTKRPRSRDGRSHTLPDHARLGISAGHIGSIVCDSRTIPPSTYTKLSHFAARNWDRN